MLSVNLPQQQLKQETSMIDTVGLNPKSTGSYFVINSKIEPDFEYKGYYKFGKVLGQGSFGTVIECVRKSDNKQIALKFFKHKAIHKWFKESAVIGDLDEKILNTSDFFSKHKYSNEERYLPSEVTCLIAASKINGVVKLLDYLPSTEDVHLESNGSELDSDNDKTNLTNDESIIGIVLERSPNEICLFDYLIERDFLSEDEAKIILIQIVQISINLLQNGIFHGDLKSENILIDPRTKIIKIIDFGSAQLIESSLTSRKLNRCHKASTKPVRTFRGTNLYKPPEYLTHHCFYPRPSTVWSFGIILFDMVCGQFPFQNDSEVLMRQDTELLFSRPNLSESFKDLVKKCLAFYVADRIVIDKIISHPWFTI